MKEDTMKNGQTKPGYNLQIVAENQFVIDFSLFPNPTDTLTLIPFFHSFQNHYNCLPNIDMADSGYGSEENYRFMRENGIEAFVKSPKAAGIKHKDVKDVLCAVVALKHGGTVL